MPQISYNKTGGVIRWDRDDWLGGLHPQWSSSTSVGRKGSKLAFSQATDPYRNLGLLAPGYAPTDDAKTSIIDAVQLNAVVTGAFAYMGGGGKVHRYDTVNDTITDDTAGKGYAHTIDHAHNSENFRDVIIYNAKISGTSAARVFYSFDDATDWDVGVVTDLAAAPNTFDDDFMSTAPATPLDLSSGYEGGAGFPHPMKVGIDDILYIGDRNFVHAYDGQNAADADGKFFAAVLTLPSGYVITGFARLDPTTLVIFAYKTNASGSFYLGQSTAFFWDYLSADPDRVIDLNDNYVSCPFEYKGTIGCFTEGRPVDKSNTSKVAQLRIFNGTNFESVASFIDESGGTTPNMAIGGVDVVNDQIMWNSEGQIYSYGNNLGEKNVLNRVTKTSGATSGLLKSITSTKQFASSGTTTSGGFQSLNSNYNTNALVCGGLAEPEFPTGFKGRIKKVRYFFNAACTGGLALDLSIRVNDRATNYAIISGLTVVSAGSLIIERTLLADSTALPDFDSIYPIFDWGTGAAVTDSPVINKVEVEFENLSITP